MAILSSAAVTKNKLFEQAHANLYNVLKDNIDHPVVSGRKLVYVRMPFEGGEFKSWPVIVVPPIDLRLVNDSMSGTVGTVSWEATIMIITHESKSDAEGTPSGAEQINSLSDSVVKTLNSNRMVLNNLGMAHFEVADTNFEWDIDEGIYSREIIVVFRKVLEIA